MRVVSYKLCKCCGRSCKKVDTVAVIRKADGLKLSIELCRACHGSRSKTWHLQYREARSE